MNDSQKTLCWLEASIQEYIVYDSIHMKLSNGNLILSVVTEELSVVALAWEWLTSRASGAWGLRKCPRSWWRLVQGGIQYICQHSYFTLTGVLLYINCTLVKLIFLKMYLGSFSFWTSVSMNIYLSPFLPLPSKKHTFSLS